MELYIGGYAQGKLEYVLTQRYPEEKYQILDGEKEDADMEDISGEGIVVFCHFHQWFRRMLSEGRKPEMLLQGILESTPEIIIISDEVGNGIVPVDAAEREYRERLGRSLTGLAKQAERVERVICGLGQRLK